MLTLTKASRFHAVISTCGRYRYRLSRHWGEGPPLLFVMLNPSEADVSLDDNTIRKCISLTRASWSPLVWGGIEVVNLFAYRTKDPALLRRVEDPIGPANDAHIRAAAHADGMIAVVGWGAIKLEWQLNRARAVTAMLQKMGCKLRCYKTNGDGSPAHPLYLRGDLQPKVWQPQWGLLRQP